MGDKLRMAVTGPQMWHLKWPAWKVVMWVISKLTSATTAMVSQFRGMKLPAMSFMSNQECIHQLLTVFKGRPKPNCWFILCALIEWLNPCPAHAFVVQHKKDADFLMCQAVQSVLWQSWSASWWSTVLGRESHCLILQVHSSYHFIIQFHRVNFLGI